MPGCSALNCSNRSETGYRLFPLPRGQGNVERRKLWLKNIGRKDISRSICVCEAHFDDDQFESHRADGLRKLKPNAVPTMFNQPPHMKNVRKSRKEMIDELAHAEIENQDADVEQNSYPDMKDEVHEHPKNDLPVIKEETILKEADHTYPKFMLKQKVENIPDDNGESTTEEVLINVSVDSKPNATKPSTQARGRKRCLKSKPVEEETNVQPSNHNRKKDRRSQIPTVPSDVPHKKMKKAYVRDDKENDLQERKVFSRSDSSVEEPIYEDPIPEEPIPPEKKDCFVCGKSVQTCISLNTLTNTTKIYMFQKLDRIVTGDMDILIEEEGILCLRCANLLNYMDRIEVELTMLNKAILNCIRKKYGMGTMTDKGQETLLPNIEYDQNNVGRLVNLDLEKSYREESNEQWASAEDMEDASPSNEMADLEEMQTSDIAAIEEMQCQLCNFKTCYKSVMIFHLRQHVRNLYHCDFCSVLLPEKSVSMVSVDDTDVSSTNDMVTEIPVQEAEQTRSNIIEIDGTGQTTHVVNNAELVSNGMGYLVTVVPVGKMDEDKEDCGSVDLQDNANHTVPSLHFMGHTKQIKVLNEMHSIITQEIKIDNEEENVQATESFTTPCLSFQNNVEFQAKNMETNVSEVGESECDSITAQASESKNENYLHNEMDMIVVTEAESNSDVEDDDDDDDDDDEMRVNITPGMLTYSSERRLNISLKNNSFNLKKRVYRR